MFRRDSESSVESFLETSLTAEQRSMLEVMTSDSISILTVQTQQVQYVMSFSESDISEAFYFNELNITDFLSQFQRLEKKHEITEEELIEILSDYCE